LRVLFLSESGSSGSKDKQDAAVNYCCPEKNESQENLLYIIDDQLFVVFVFAEMLLVFAGSFFV